MTRPLTLRRAAWASALALPLAALLACTTETLYAHEWPSPAPTSLQPPAGAWSGMVWAGPQTGAPAAPSARHCARAPQAFELGAGAPWDGPQQCRRPGDC